MNRITLIRDGAGERRYQLADYPLNIGGKDAAIPVPGHDLPVAYIGQQKGHPFVQPAASGVPIWHNHEQVIQSTWLKSGDQLQIDRVTVFWQVQGDQIVVSLGEADAIPLTAPVAPPPVNPACPAQPAAVTAEMPRSQPLRRWLLGGLFLLLLAITAFVMLASSLILEIDPEPDSYSLEGFAPALVLADRALLLPGSYRLQARARGYHDLQQTIDIDFNRDHRVHFSMQKLPGLVNVSSIPDGARVTVDHSSVGVTPLELELPVGPHRFRIEAPRHIPAETELNITGMGRRQQLELQLEPDWATVTLDSEPSGAEIREQGQLLGSTPITLELDSGEHPLSLQLEGYKRVQQRIAVVAGQAQALPRIRLTPLDGILALKSVPKGSAVAVDGKHLGSTPLELELESGREHKLVFSKAGYQPARRTVALEPGKRRQLEIRLKAEYGIVFITSQPADAELLVDGKPQGRATTRLRLSSRPHQIEVRKKGYATYRQTVTPRKGKSRNMVVTLKPTGGAAASGSQTTSAGRILRLIVPKRSFTMGASRREPGRRANENLRDVSLTRPFLMGSREVTNAEFRRFRPAHDSGRLKRHSLNADDQPVVNVSWDDAAGYLNWLSRHDGLPPAYESSNGKLILRQPVTSGYRLPTEAEWAYAARYSGRNQGVRYAWSGSGFPPPAVQGNYADQSAAGLLPVTLEGYRDGFAVAAPVGSFKPNPASIYDMDGNVAEWVYDFYGIYPGSAGKAEQDPLGPASGRHHVVRGSSWRDAGMSALRLSYRDYSSKPRDDLGFRIARYPGKQDTAANGR